MKIQHEQDTVWPTNVKSNAVEGITTLKCSVASLKALKNFESANFTALGLLTIFKALAYAKNKSYSNSALKK
jgi:hypothetical protein